MYVFKVFGMDCFGTYFTHVQTCSVPRVCILGFRVTLRGGLRGVPERRASRYLQGELKEGYLKEGVTLQVWTCVKYVPQYTFRSMYRSSPFRSTLNTGYITGLDMCKVCIEAGHSVAL